MFREAVADTLTYDSLASEFKTHTIGADIQHIKREARTAVIRICTDLDLIQRTEEHEWAEDGVYRMAHEGMSFIRIRSVWREEQIQQNLYDDSYITDRQVGIVESTFRLLGAREKSLLRSEKTIINFSLAPPEEGDTFPLQIYRQYRELIQAGCLMKMGSFLRTNTAGATPHWGSQYQDGLKRARRKLNNLPGPPTVQPFFGGYGDYYGEGGWGGWSNG